MDKKYLLYLILQVGKLPKDHGTSSCSLLQSCYWLGPRKALKMTFCAKESWTAILMYKYCHDLPRCSEGLLPSCRDRSRSHQRPADVKVTVLRQLRTRVDQETNKTLCPRIIFEWIPHRSARLGLTPWCWTWWGSCSRSCPRSGPWPTLCWTPWLSSDTGTSVRWGHQVIIYPDLF